MIRVNHIVEETFVDGPGRRTAVFLQGCPIHCKGCQNKALWPAEGGTAMDEDDLASTLARLAITHGNITISGGEPFAQPASLTRLIRSLRNYGVKNIIVYTGYAWEDLMGSPFSPWLWVTEILPYIDILVDGPFIKALDDDLITFRGSRNQRPIDVQTSLLSWTLDKQVAVLNWDNPEITLTEAGDLVLPRGLTMEFSEIGQVENTRMCGQTRRVRG
jgi:anaerobic ribonucleoside-triphosphate reductase activating protein